MSTSTPMDPVSFTNSLDVPIIIYDSWSEGHPTNYFGTLTEIATVQANTTASVRPIHKTSTFIISNATTHVPLARRLCSRVIGLGPFTVGQADATAMAQTMAFINLNIQQPQDPTAKAFQTILNSSKSTDNLVQPIDQFFKQHAAYGQCTFVTYMLGITWKAEQLVSQNKPMDQAVYSLSSLVRMLGGSWPTGFPDIAITNFTCNADNGVLAIQAKIDLDKLPAQTDQALKFFGSLFGTKKLQVAVDFNYGFSLGFSGTRLAIGLDAIHVPCGGLTSLTINHPMVSIDINPLFKFVVFTIKGAIPFSIFGKAFEADVSMTIDNMEASFGVVIKGDNNSLPSPPVMKGVHFDQFGVGIGVFFEPPSIAIGLSGKLHIGQPNGFSVALDDDTFAVVCSLVEEVPNPLYASFYVPHMYLTDVLTVFTNKQAELEVPVSFTNLSFRWSEDPMEPVVLPDGSLSNMGYGFSAAANILAFSFYGDIKIDLTNGLDADLEMSPVALGDIFSIGGSGMGVSIKVDASGSPIKNNQVPTTVAQRDAIKNATMKQMVPAGGPVLKLQTTSSPFLVLNGHVSLFEVAHESLNAVISKSGITFQVDFGSVLATKISCTLCDWHNLAATFDYGINQRIQLPSLFGVGLGSFSLQALVNTHFSLSTSTSDLILRVGGGFSFAGLHRTFGDFTVDGHIQKVTDLLSAIARYIESMASQIFGDLVCTGEAWAGKVKGGVIQAIDTVADVLHKAFNEDAHQIASTMKVVGFGVDEITGQLKNIFDPSQVASALQNTFNLSEQGVASAMKEVGYAGQDVAQALKSTFGADAGAIASAMQGAYGWSADQIHSVLDQIGFSANQIGDAFKSLGGEFASAGQTILDSLKHIGNCSLM